MRNAFAQTFYEAAKADERLAIVVADISAAGSMERFRREYPQRFVNTGVAEQIMIGMAAGMAMRGLRPFAYTIATFALFRPYEFIRCDLAYQNLPVTVVGVGGGVTYSQLGGTHHAMEDVAVACAIPGMTVLAPCDPLETAACVKWCAQQNGGPVYLRLGKAGEPNLKAADPHPDYQYEWEVGKLHTIRAGMARTAVIGYGPILGLAMNTGADVYSCHTLKPLDRIGIANVIRQYERVLILEESVPYLGPLAKMIAWEHDLRWADIQHICLRDEFIHTYGSHADLLAEHGLTVEKIRSTLNG